MRERTHVKTFKAFYLDKQTQLYICLKRFQRIFSRLPVLFWPFQGGGDQVLVSFYCKTRKRRRIVTWHLHSPSPPPPPKSLILLTKSELAGQYGLSAVRIREFVGFIQKNLFLCVSIAIGLESEKFKFYSHSISGFRSMYIMLPFLISQVRLNKNKSPALPGLNIILPGLIPGPCPAGSIPFPFGMIR